MNSASATAVRLDEATTRAIREALAAAQAGRLAEACDCAERALSQGGDAGALNALLGMLRTRGGDAVRAVQHLEIAHRARPTDAHIATNLAGALMTAGNYARALEILTEDLTRSDPTNRLTRMRGYAAQMSGEFRVAVEAYERVIGLAPDDWETLNNLGNARLATGDLEGAIAALTRSADVNPQAAPTRLNLARTLRMVGRIDEAERELLQIAGAFPEDVKALLDLHDLLKELGREDEDVLRVLIQANMRAPDDLGIRLALGRQHGLMFNYSASEKWFRQALELDPANAEALLALATLYDHKDSALLDGLAAEAERRGIEPNSLNLIRAFAHRRAKRDEEGLAVLADLPADFEPQRREELLGQFHDRLAHYDEAFAAFTRMNEHQALDPSQPLERAAGLRRQLRERIGQTTADWAASWTAPAPEPDRRAPVFLFGFPRSGTTLLDTMLMGHPDVEMMEERPPLNDVSKSLGSVEAIAGLEADQLLAAQGRYFEEAARYVPLRKGSVIVDKSPLHLNAVQYIHRLFPNARLVLALRHPADAVLSCFVSSFRLNPSMANFLRLDTAAEFYDLALGNWEATRSLFPLQVHTVRYEDLVEDTGPVLRGVAEAIGLSWHDGLLEHQETAANRGVITTASYAQVTEPIYRRSVGRWRHYRKHLEPILPVLQPWIDKFGYSV